MSKPNLVAPASTIDTPEADLTVRTPFEQIVEQAPMAISITDTNATILYVNAGFSDITGYAAEEVTGLNHSILSYRSTPAHIYQSLWKTLQDGECWQGKLINRRKNGERYLAEVMISPVRNENGKVTRYMGIHRDVTASHEIKTLLTNQHAMFKAVLNAAPVAVALLDENRFVVMDNLAYKALAADYEQELAHQIMAKLQSQLGNQATEKLKSHDFNEGHSVALEGRRGKRWFSCRIASLAVQDLGVDAYFQPKASAHQVLTITEHTREKRRSEQQRISELQRLTIETELVHAMQETLRAAIHQIQGPINMIDAAVSMLCHRSGRCPGTDAMDQALNAGSDAIEQLQQALPERPEEARQPLNINQLIHDVSAMSTERLLARSIPLQLNLEATLPSLLGQPCRLRVAMKQLLENAIDAVDFGKAKHRELSITTRSEEDAVVLLIEDSGPGVPKEKQLKVFQPFYSTKPAATAGSRGIGLSIVQQVLNEHSGSMRFTDSELGGCGVEVILPRLSH